MIESGRVRLSVSDVERSLRFYVETLGVKLVTSDNGGARVDLGGGFEVDLVADAGSGASPAALALTLRGDFAEAVATYENRGLAIERHDTYAECTDPDGNVLRFEPSP